jgi:hypothetical protein
MINLTARHLRTGIRSPQALARQLLHARLAPIDPDTPRSPQRAWMDASLRRYFERQRHPDVLFADYDCRTGRAKRNDTAATEIANGRRMLAHFVALDQSQPDPDRVQMKPAAVTVLGQGVVMGVDLAYETPTGWVLRHLITDDEIRRAEHLRLYATAAALHFEGRPDGGHVARVELWLLRHEGRVEGWPRSLLEKSIPSLAVRLSEIARGASGQVA